MSEIIESITNKDNFKFPDEKTDWDTFEGFEVKTNKQTILFGVSNRSGCCESWGHVSSVDEFSDFIGAELHAVVNVDEGLKTCEIEDVYDGGSVFINFVTDKGVLQFAVYNSHNGYYGHDARIACEQLNFTECI